MAPEESDESARPSSSDDEEDSAELDDDDVKAELESESKSRKMCNNSTAGLRPAKEEIFCFSTWF